MNSDRPLALGQRRQWIGAIYGRMNRILQRLAPPSVAQLVLRLALAVPFWRSGINKWDGIFQLNDVAVLLFSDEFQLHLPGGPYPYPAPALIAFIVGCAEILLPSLLVLGLSTRLAALALLVMTVMVQLTVPEGWPLHLTWAAMALAVVAWGPGRVSLDHWIARGNE
jgi:putative oxidoreductase